MPKRKIEQEIIDVTAEKPKVNFKKLSSEGKLEIIAQKGLHYLSLKREADGINGKIKKENAEIKNLVIDSNIYDINGEHKEIYAPVGDGLNEIFVQVQKRTSVGYVDNIVDLVRQKLGAKADNFIMKVEVLHKDGLEAMFNQGLITKSDISDWTTQKESESLIVKLNKKHK